MLFGNMPPDSDGHTCLVTSSVLTKGLISYTTSLDDIEYYCAMGGRF